VPLFDRAKRQIHLTNHGEQFLKDARAVLASADSAVANVQRSLRGEVGTLTIGFFGGGTETFFPAIIKGYRRRFQDVRVSLVEMTPGMHHRALQSGAIDIAFTRRPCNVGCPKSTFRTLSFGAAPRSDAEQSSSSKEAKHFYTRTCQRTIHSCATMRSKPVRVTILAADRPRSSSMISTSLQPSEIASPTATSGMNAGIATAPFGQPVVRLQPLAPKMLKCVFLFIPTVIRKAVGLLTLWPLLYSRRYNRIRNLLHIV
jgi:DNA-binding transcriptional LysR family regulator